MGAHKVSLNGMGSEERLDANEKSERDPWASRWRALEHQIETETAAAVDTFRFWNRTTIAALRKTDRLLLWLADNQASGGLVKDISNLTWRSFLGRGWTTLAVFSDTIAVVQKNDYQIFDFPLVWLEPIQTPATDNKAIVKVRTPESDFDIEFFDACGKTAFIQACSYWRSGTTNSTPPIRRTGTHRYSNSHPTYRNCSYVGSWQLGKPHGLGVIVYPDGKTYKGHFHDGVIQGFGEMSIPSEPQSASIMNSMFFVDSTPPVSATQKCDVCVGKWAGGQMNGLVAIKYGDGSSYEGYCKNGLRHGHGVMRSSVPFIGATIYVGSWREGVKHGYGVHSTNKERYLGMWQDGLKHGLGALVTIDGIFHEGVFEKDKMTKGRLVMEGDSPLDYEGDFENVGVPSGRGALQVTPFLRIEGSISGNILNGEVKINAGTLLRTPEDKRLKGRSMEDDGPHESAVGKWTVLPDDKWMDIFAQFELEYYGIDDPSQECDAKTLWNNLVGSLAKIKAFKNLKFDDEMERIPDFEADWSNSYYAMAREFWVLATAAKGVHPLHRLLKGITEVFTCSYNNIGTHPALYDQVVLEFRSLIRRTYGVVRRLFVNLPAIDDMYEGVPQRADVIHRDSDASDTPSAESAVTSSSGGEGDRTLERQKTSNRYDHDDSLSVPTPACDFVLNSLFAECYAVLYTICSVSCAEMDRKYWERVLYLNAHTDVKLLTYLEVDRDLWPIDIEDASDLDAPMIRATARKKFYKSAIHTMQRLSCEYNPTAKLAILAETFSEISTCVSRFALAGSEHVWSSDDLLPAFMYVVVRAQIQHLGAEIRLIEDFSPHLRGAGQIELMFTMLKASFVHICTEKSLP
ncbi:hypothetical protein QR680_007146 [Steinernema hermaphroditum]|uniref:VPS9 domain-containing protein n=1 Tax=Steinernema hermaphroditum TaxID=289476 RepID=A0AA39HXW3_9BILA|nr:hypothetical protein QR680_007146 [Steinernema hermaphroditum]